jgi:hypothetical protein
MSHSYKFTSELPLIFSDLSHSDEVTVKRAHPEDVEAPEGSTVVLYPGDILTVPAELDHAWLELLDAKPETAAQKKARVKAEKAAALEITPGEVVNANGSKSTELTPATPEDIAAAIASGDPIADAIVSESTSAPEGDQS